MSGPDLADSSSRAAARGRAVVGAGVFLALAGALYAAVMAASGGVFSFTLDDPYIHLAMAEEIARGGYGVNPGEAASASSSVVYPFLLAAGLKLGLGQFAALWINLAAGCASTVLLLELAAAGSLVTQRTPVWASGLLAALLALGLNLGGLALSGMEHGLHVAVTLAALLGVQRLARDGRAPAWLVPVLVTAPLVRFEGAAVLGAGVLALAWRRRWAEAALASGLAAAVLGLFAWRLTALGLPPLPSSVLAKANDGAHGPGAQLVENLRTRGGWIVLAAAAVPLVGLNRLAAPLRLPVVFASLALAAQLAVGTFGWRYNGWLHRYEAWALALAAGTLLLRYGAALRAWASGAPVVRGGLVALASLVLLQPYIVTTLMAPFNSRSIRLQQYEMRRFAVDFLRAPVAVNDLGWVAWRNDREVLDLWGLASEPARRARQSHAPPQWMGELARARGVRAVMIYDDWIGRRPPEWVRLGELRARVPLTVGPRVAFYAVDGDAASAVRAAAEAWARTLPAQAVFVPEAPGVTAK